MKKDSKIYVAGHNGMVGSSILRRLKSDGFTNLIIKSKEELKISYFQHGKDRNFVGLPYLLNWALPNLYFHITTTYAILRHNGVEIGKKDFLGNS